MTSVLTISLPHLIYALSEALDLVGIDDVAHGKRVGVMASSCAKVLGLGGDVCEWLVDLGMLHDIGVSSTQTHKHLLLEFDWENSQEHAIRGANLLEGFLPLVRFSKPIRYHHTRWDRLLPMIGQSLTYEEAIAANLIFLVDRVDTFAAPYYAAGLLFEHVDEIQQRVESVAGTYFCPELVVAFKQASATEVFWLQLQNKALRNQLIVRMSDNGDRHSLSVDQLRQLATIFAQIVDAKSVFTREHSEGVMRLSVYIADQLGLSEESRLDLEIAGLLHDLGKLRIPDEILEKPGALTPHERHVMNTHSYETYQILSTIPGFENIARIAGYHHEVPDGSGYPFHLEGDALSIEARILRVADIVQALAQDRPYRRGLSASEICGHLTQLVAKGQMDADIVAAVRRDMSATLKIALGR